MGFIMLEKGIFYVVDSGIQLIKFRLNKICTRSKKTVLSPEQRVSEPGKLGILRIEILPPWMPNEHLPVGPHIQGIVNLLARASLIWLQTLEIVVSMAALSSARLFPGGNLSSTTGFPTSS
jgi:hypothetical protein